MAAGVGLPPPRTNFTPLRIPRMPPATNVVARQNISDANSGGGVGYGSYQVPTNPNILANYVNAFPAVVNANQNYLYEGGVSQAQMREAIQNAVIKLGDPSVALALGQAVLPGTAELAAANTTSGVSDIGQFRIAAATARQNMLDRMAASGGAYSGALPAGLGQQDYANLLNLNNITSQAQGTIGTAIDTNNTNLAKLLAAKNAAVVNATGVVENPKNVSSYPMIAPKTVTVGGGVTPVKVPFQYTTPTVPPPTASTPAAPLNPAPPGSVAGLKPGSVSMRFGAAPGGAMTSTLPGASPTGF